MNRFLRLANLFFLSVLSVATVVVAVAQDIATTIDVETGVTDLPTTTYSGTATLIKTGAGTLQWGYGAATFALSAGSLIDVRGGTFIGGSMHPTRPFYHLLTFIRLFGDRSSTIPASGHSARSAVEEPH